MTADKDKITLIFIINGENFPVDANEHAPLLVAVERALQLSGNTGRRDPREWEVRDAAGVLLEVERSPNIAPSRIRNLETQSQVGFWAR